MDLHAFLRRTIALAALTLPFVPLAAQEKAPAPVAAPAAAAASEQDGGTPTFVRPETPEQRKARLGTAEDPGLDPDPAKVWWRFGKPQMIERYERRWAAYDQTLGFVRPMAMVNFAAEIYQQNEKYVWVWMPVFENGKIVDPTAEEPKAEMPPAPAALPKYTEADIEYFKKVRSEFSELSLPSSNRVVRFEESSTGLPDSGSWRNSLAVADMNNDGKMDLVAPPERGARNFFPSIFLNDGKGGWKFWEEVEWPYALDYGGVAAGDFNKDGNQDLVFAVHLEGVHVFLGDGKGKFVDASEGLPREFATRRVATADVDADGDLDVIAISEGPTMVQRENERVGKIRVFLNEKKGRAWKGVDVVAPDVPVGGDWLTIANLNGDKYPDIIGSSVYFGSSQVVNLSNGPKSWSFVRSHGRAVPSHAFILASAAARFGSKKQDDVIISTTRVWPASLNEIVGAPATPELTGLDRLVMTKDGLGRVPVIRFAGATGIAGVAAGDVDGDGNNDVLFVRNSPREAMLLLGDGKGGFTVAKLEGLPIENNSTYDVKLADVNGDRRLDVIMMYETASTTALASRDGSIRVYLNRTGTKSASASAK